MRRKIKNIEAVTPVIGTTLIVAIMLTTSAMIAGWGIPMINDQKAKTESQRALSEMKIITESFESQVYGIVGSTVSGQVSLGESGSVKVTSESNTLVPMYNTKDGYDFDITGIDDEDNGLTVTMNEGQLSKAVVHWDIDSISAGFSGAEDPVVIVLEPPVVDNVKVTLFGRLIDSGLPSDSQANVWFEYSNDAYDLDITNSDNVISTSWQLKDEGAIFYQALTVGVDEIEFGTPYFYRAGVYNGLEYNHSDKVGVSYPSFTIPEPLPGCGNGICDGDETCDTCPADCSCDVLEVMTRYPNVYQATSDGRCNVLLKGNLVSFGPSGPLADVYFGYKEDDGSGPGTNPGDYTTTTSESKSGTGLFSKTVNLKHNTWYYYRAFVDDGTDTDSGDYKRFKTNEYDPSYTAPTISTSYYTKSGECCGTDCSDGCTGGNVQLRGSVVDMGSEDIIYCYFDFNGQESPSGNNKIPISSPGPFSLHIIGIPSALECGHDGDQGPGAYPEYYYQAKADCPIGGGVVFGGDETFTTGYCPLNPPVVDFVTAFWNFDERELDMYGEIDSMGDNTEVDVYFRYAIFSKITQEQLWPQDGGRYETSHGIQTSAGPFIRTARLSSISLVQSFLIYFKISVFAEGNMVGGAVMDGEHPYVPTILSEVNTLSVTPQQDGAGNWYAILRGRLETFDTSGAPRLEGYFMYRNKIVSSDWTCANRNLVIPDHFDYDPDDLPWTFTYDTRNDYTSLPEGDWVVLASVESGCGAIVVDNIGKTFLVGEALEGPLPPIVYTTEADAVQDNSLRLRGELWFSGLNADNDPVCNAVSFLWRERGSNDAWTSTGTVATCCNENDDLFEHTITGLDPCTEYEFYAHAEQIDPPGESDDDDRILFKRTTGSDCAEEYCYNCEDGECVGKGYSPDCSVEGYYTDANCNNNCGGDGGDDVPCYYCVNGNCQLKGYYSTCGTTYYSSSDCDDECDGGGSNSDPNDPSVPSGASSTITGIAGTETYSTSATDPDGDLVKYKFFWGDGCESLWTALGSSGSTKSKSHFWAAPGTYSVKAIAQDSHGAQSGFSNIKTVTVEDFNHAPSASVSANKGSAKKDEAVTFTASGSDQDGDAIIAYKFDAKYKSETSWSSSATYTTSWSNIGSRWCKAKVKDEHGKESLWSSKCYVTVTLCFAAGTKVAMADGTYKPIEDIKIGDIVKSYDEQTKSFVKATVTDSYSFEPESMWDNYYIIINGKLKVTPDHMIIINGEWKEACELNIGDALFSIENKEICITSLERVYKQIPTYNIELDEYHTFFAEGFLVHNPDYPSIIIDGGDNLIAQNSPSTPVKPTVQTGIAYVNGNSALLTGTLLDLGSAISVDVYFKYGEQVDYNSALPNNLPYTTASQTLTQQGSFEAYTQELIPGTYVYVAVADGDGISYGQVMGTGGSSSGSLTVETLEADVDGQEVILNGEVTAMDGYKTVERGFKWGIKSGQLTEEPLMVGYSSNPGVFSRPPASFPLGRYFYRAFARGSPEDGGGSDENPTVETLDQYNNEDGVTVVPGMLETDSASYAQTFKAGLSGELSKVRLKLKLESGRLTPLTVKIYPTTLSLEGGGLIPDTSDSSKLLASTTINKIDSGAFAFAEGTFVDPASVVEGTTYALVVDSTELLGVNYHWKYNYPDYYSDGKSFRYTKGSDGGEVDPKDGGESVGGDDPVDPGWVVVTTMEGGKEGIDLMFETYVLVGGESSETTTSLSLASSSLDYAEGVEMEFSVFSSGDDDGGGGGYDQLPTDQVFVFDPAISDGFVVLSAFRPIDYDPDAGNIGDYRNGNGIVERDFIVDESEGRKGICIDLFDDSSGTEEKFARIWFFKEGQYVWVSSEGYKVVGEGGSIMKTTPTAATYLEDDPLFIKTDDTLNIMITQLQPEGTSSVSGSGTCKITATLKQNTLRDIHTSGIDKKFRLQVHGKDSTQRDAVVRYFEDIGFSKKDSEDVYAGLYENELTYDDAYSRITIRHSIFDVKLQ